MFLSVSIFVFTHHKRFHVTIASVSVWWRFKTIKIWILIDICTPNLIFIFFVIEHVVDYVPIVVTKWRGPWLKRQQWPLIGRVRGSTCEQEQPLFVEHKRSPCDLAAMFSQKYLQGSGVFQLGYDTTALVILVVLVSLCRSAIQFHYQAFWFWFEFYQFFASPSYHFVIVCFSSNWSW